MRLRQITPFVPCTSLERQIGFYRDILGFSLGFRADNYTFLRRDDAAVRLLEIEEGCDAPEPRGSYYIDVDDIDALYASMTPQLNKLPKERVRAPFDQEYGQREFHVLDEDGTLIFFGQPVKQQST